MLVEITYIRDARSITQEAPPQEIAADNVVAGAFVRSTRAIFTGGVIGGTGAGATVFTDLTDVPSSYTGQANKQVTVKADESGLEFVSPAIPTVPSFLELTDTPDDYTGQANKQVTVKGDESGLEFVPVPSSAPTDAHYLTTRSEVGLSAERDLSVLGDGILKQTVTGGESTPAIATEGTDYLGPPRISDAAYDATTWNGDADHAPSKNAVRDIIESLATGGAPANAHYLTTQAEGGLSNEFNLGGLSAGLLKQDVTGGVSTPAIAAEGTDYLGPARIDDAVYDPVGWNGDATHAPSKNAVRDEVEVIEAAIGSILTDARWTNDRTANAIRTQTVKAIDASADPTDKQVLSYDAPSGKWKPVSVATSIIRNFAFGLRKSSGVPVGKIAGYWTCPFAGLITAWNLIVDAGTITVKIWKIATGTAHPTNANSINTSGLSLASGTNIHSTSLGDFTTLAVAVGDIFACEITAATGVSDFGGSVEITQT